jgi:hypothetical protein
MFNSNAYAEMCIPKVRDFPLTLKLHFEMCKSFFIAAHIKEVINMDSCEDHAKIITMEVDAVFALEPFEASREECSMHCSVLHSSSLLHAIKTLLKLPYSIFLAWFGKTCRN